MSASDVAVSVRGLSKSYTIAHDQEKHITLAETLLSRLKNPLRRPKTETFWALKDIEFDIKKGDVVGIIGRNGAGKSTLLKILSRITEPTTGKIDLYGRVGSLLEVGTGFHPELTGRENIFLNGAILGMSKPDITKQFDAIVDFSGVEQFIDTPVKRYSSGMYVRLAFAVAAHLESEILIIDEVLAVGDVEFQKKCLGKIGSVANDGRTVLFVSHNGSAVKSLCNRAILFKNGQVVADGLSDEVADQYFSASFDLRLHWRRPESMPLSSEFSFRSVRTKDSEGVPRAAFKCDQSIKVEIEYVCHHPLDQWIVTVGVYNRYGVHLFDVGDTDSMNLTGTLRDGGSYLTGFSIPPFFLSPGTYGLKVGAGILGNYASEVIENAVSFEVLPEKCVQPLDRRKPGILSPLIPWETVRSHSN